MFIKNIFRLVSTSEETYSFSFLFESNEISAERVKLFLSGSLALISVEFKIGVAVALKAWMTQIDGRVVRSTSH